MLIVDGRLVPVPGVCTVSFRDDPAWALKIPEDGRPRPRPHDVRAVVLHTTRGIPGGRDQRPQVVRPGFGFSGPAARTLANWRQDSRHAGAHLLVDFDGTMYCLADLVRTSTYHAGAVNRWTVGVEICQGRDAELYVGQLESVARLCSVVCAELGIPRRCAWPYRGRAVPGIERFRGAYGHRDCSDNRGAGDPGDAVFEYLQREGFEPADPTRVSALT